MLKKDLKDGMILEVRKGQRHLLTNGVMRDYYGYLILKSYSDDLKNIYDEDFDIVKVYKDTGRFSLQDILEDRNLTLIWERKEITLTDREVEVLKALKTLDYTYIARDEDGELYAYQNKPEKHTNTNEWLNDYIHYLIKKYETLFNFIKWEDKEPTIIDDLLKGVIS